MTDHYEFIDALNYLTHPEHRAKDWLKEISNVLKFGKKSRKDGNELKQ